MDIEHLLAVRDSADQLYSRAEVEQALDRLATEIEAVVGDQDPLLLCVMTGGLVVSSELFTRLGCPVQLDYLHATRYQGTRGGDELKWITPPSKPLAGRTVVVVDDILDEGLTLAAILRYCLQCGAGREESRPQTRRGATRFCRPAGRRPLRVRLRHGLPRLLAQSQRHLCRERQLTTTEALWLNWQS
jgi:hypothetical protein